MKFEEALALMREGKTVLDPYGQEVTLENGKFMRSTYIANPLIKGCVTQFSDKYILEEWTVKEEHKYQYLFRLKGMKDWILTNAKYFSVEDLRKSLPSFCIALGDFKEIDNEDWEFRRIEP